MVEISKVILVVSFIFTFTCSFGQQLINGRIIDENSKPMPYANVILINQVDSTFILGTVTNTDGTFSMQTMQPNGLLKISYLGYETNYVNFNNSSIGEIKMEPDAMVIKDVVVKGRQNPLSIENGTFTLNVSKTFLKNQPDIFSVLGFLPFVESSQDKISVFAAGSTLYIINGREVKSMMEIENLRPDMIKSITLDMHPSAQYASKYGSVISVTTITKIEDFVNSQVSHKSVVARRYSDTEGINLNAKYGRIAHYLSYQFKDSRKKEWAENEYHLFNEKSLSTISYNNSENFSNSYNPQHELLYSAGLMLNGQSNLNFQYMLEVGRANDHDNSIEKTLIGTTETNLKTDQKNRDNNQLHNVDLLYKYNSKVFGSLFVDASYTFSKDEQSYLINTNGNNLDNIDGNNRYCIYSLQADYQNQILGGIRMQVGTKYSYTHNKGLSDSYNPLGSDMYFYHRTQLNDELVANYITLSHQIKKLYLSVGLRGEYYHSNYMQDDNVIYKDSRFNFYPSIQVNYTVNPELIFVTGYNSKSQRPTFTELSPVVYYINAMLYEQGNPGLRMTSTHNSYISCVIKNRLLIQLSYRYDKNFVMYALHNNQEVAGNIINSPVNINASYFNLKVSYSNKIGFYRFSYNANFQCDVTKVPVLDSWRKRFKPLCQLSTVNQFNVGHQTMIFSDFGIASSYWSLGNTIQPSYKLRIGLYKTFFADKRLALTISANDILNRSNPNSVTEYGYVWYEQHPHLDTRNISITLKYNINKFKNIYKKNTVNDEEINRIK